MGVKTKRQMIRFLIVLLIILFVSCVSKNDSPEIPGEIPTKALFEGQLGALPDEADKLIGEVEQIKEDLVIQNPFENVQMPGQKREILNETRITFLGVMHFEDFSSFHEYNIDVTYFQYTQVYRVENLSGTLDCKTYISTTDLGESPELSEIFENGYLLFNHLINLSGETVLTFDSLTSEGANEILQALNDSIDENQAISIYIYTIKTYNNFDDNTIIATDEAEVTITVDLNLEKENSLPTLEKISGPNGEMHEATSVFKWQGQDQDGHINSYKISKDGIEETIADTQATWTGYTEGEHVFSVQGTDNRGGLSNIIEWLFSLSPNQPPVVEKVSGPDNWESIDENSATFEWSGTDEMQGRDIKKYQIKKDEGNWQDIVPSDNTFYIWNDIEVDIHTFGVRAVDNNDAFSEVIEWYFNYGTPERTLLVKAIPGIGGDIQINNQGWRDIDEINLPEGVTVQLKAREAVGWKFMIWNQTDDLTGDFVPIFEKEFIYTMPDYNHELFAGFAQLCQVTAESSPNNGGKVKIDDGELTEKASKTVAEGTQVELEAVENDDYTFEGWVDDTGLVSVESQYSVTVNEDKDFKALFEPQPEEFLLRVFANPAEGGDIELEDRGWKDEDNKQYKEGDPVELRAREAEGWQFIGWFYDNWQYPSDAISTDDVYFYTMEGTDITIRAEFIYMPTITVESSPNNGGKVKIDDGELTEKASKTVAEGTQVELEAVENDDYTFEGWVDDTGLVSVESQYSVTVNEDKDFKALFEAIAVYETVVLAEPKEGGDIQVGNGGWKDEERIMTKIGDQLSLDARAEEGWRFVGWYYTDATEPQPLYYGNDPHWEFIVDASNTRIEAQFCREHTITAESSPNNGGKVKIDDGELTEKASKTVEEGTQVALEAVENEGYTFEGWVEDTGLVSVESQIWVIVEQDKLLTALFEPVEPLDEYNLIVRANPAKGGDIQIDDQGWKDEDTIIAVETALVPLHAREEPQWIFLGWYWGGQFYPMEAALSSNKDYDFQMVGYEADLEALFGFIPETVPIEGSIFTMGDTFDDGEPNEKPVHEVALVWDFSIGKYEVTNEQYVQFLNSAGVEYNDEDRWGYLNGRKIIDERYFEQTGIVYSPGWGWDLKGDHQGTVYDYGQMPVINVTWFGAVEYCNWLSEINGMYPAYEWDEDKQTYILNDYPPNPGYRLPTEAEWEYTARGGQNRVDNGNQWAGTSDDNCCEDYGWFEDNSNRMPQPVGGKLPNEVGTYDMSGNAIEWTSDVYREYSPGSETCPYHPGEDGQENPHVARGGGFDWNDYNSTVCARFIEMNNLWSTPLQLDYVGGFRIAKSE